MLQQTKRHPGSTLTVRSAEGLRDVAKHLLRLLELGAKSRYLVITWHEMNYVQLMNQEGVPAAGRCVQHRRTNFRFASDGLWIG